MGVWRILLCIEHRRREAPRRAVDAYGERLRRMVHICAMRRENTGGGRRVCDYTPWSICDCAQEERTLAFQPVSSLLLVEVQVRIPCRSAYEASGRQALKEGQESETYLLHNCPMLRCRAIRARMSAFSPESDFCGMGVHCRGGGFLGRHRAHRARDRCRRRTV